MSRCGCWNVARDGHAVDCEAVREERRRERRVSDRLLSRLTETVRSSGAVVDDWTEAGQRLAGGDR